MVSPLMNVARTRSRSRSRSLSNPQLPTPLARDHAEALVRVRELLASLTESLGDAFGLTERERSIAYLVLFGSNTYAIAQHLELDERTILAQIQALFANTGAQDRDSLLRLSLRLACARDSADVPMFARPGPVPPSTASSMPR
jgi:DNA-binding NarL/FixJ family response regulator